MEYKQILLCFINTFPILEVVSCFQCGVVWRRVFW